MWSFINGLSNGLYDSWFRLLQDLSPVWQIGITALPMTMLALLVYRYASDQEGINATKDRIKAYLLELWLYKDDLGIILNAQGQVLRYSLRYMKFSLVPLAIMIIPFALTIIQLESHFAFRALEPGEPSILAVTVDSDSPISTIDVDLSLPDKIYTETPALRADDAGQVLWRISAAEAGVYNIRLQIGDSQVVRRLVVGDDIKLWPAAYRESDWRLLGSPAEAPIPDHGIATMTEISYPRARAELLGLSTASWLFLGFTILFGFALRGVFRVTF